RWIILLAHLPLPLCRSGPRRWVLASCAHFPFSRPSITDLNNINDTWWQFHLLGYAVTFTRFDIRTACARTVKTRTTFNCRGGNAGRITAERLMQIIVQGKCDGVVVWVVGTDEVVLEAVAGLGNGLVKAASF